MKINLHIERVVLEGIPIPPEQHQALQTNLATELSQKIVEGGLSGSFTQGSALTRVTAGNIRLDGDNPLQLSRKIAQSVCGGIRNE